MTGVPKPTLVSFVNTNDGVTTVTKVSVSSAPFNAAPMVADSEGRICEDHSPMAASQQKGLGMPFDIPRPLWVSFASY